MKLLVIADTPTENTGFACVVCNTVKYWQPHFERIDIWGINYNGWPHEYPYRIFPPGPQWNALKNLARLLNFIRSGDYTHVWVLQDLFLLSDNGFAKYLKDACQEKKIRLITYYPVDAPLEPGWLDMVQLSDAAATFTDYGVAETVIARPGLQGKVRSIPHGVDTNVYKPLDREMRQKLREQYFPKGWQDSVILINVNRNERRKSLVHSLQVLDRLRRKHGNQFKLYLHCPTKNEAEQIDLQQLGSGMKLTHGEDWFAPHADDFSRGVGQFSTEQMNELYNAADVCITTTLGEGWGLSLTEAAAAGMQIVGPLNTSLPEIANIVGARMRLVPMGETAIANVNDNSRLRYPVNIEAMADKIAEVSQFTGSRFPLSDVAKETLNWERIAKSWWELF